MFCAFMIHSSTKSCYSQGDLNALDQERCDPIMRAAVYGAEDTLKIMIERGGNSVERTLLQAAKTPGGPYFHAMEVKIL